MARNLEEANAVEAFNGALLSSEGRARVDDGSGNDRRRYAKDRNTLVRRHLISSASRYNLQIVLPSLHSVARAVGGKRSLVVQLLWAQSYKLLRDRIGRNPLQRDIRRE